MRDLKWSPSEKITARKAFDQALAEELRQVVQRAKQIVAAVKEPSQLWDLETWLRQRRLEIDRKYDYRYSVLPMVFATLLKQGRISEKDLNGLQEEKIDLIVGIASRL
ncbi:MAG: hypothetical protein JO061_21355 [Acidobacteriaceae bacterium]|nr:hypothetical protein [Acidobacteriaceae bacterium]